MKKNKEISNLPSPSSGSLSLYLSQIKKFPMLDAEEEYMLAKNWKERGNLKAAHKLVTSHLRLVAKIAMGYRGYGLPVSELISEGMYWFNAAVKNFDPDKGFRLVLTLCGGLKRYTRVCFKIMESCKMGTTTAQKNFFFQPKKKLKIKLLQTKKRDLKEIK